MTEPTYVALVTGIPGLTHYHPLDSVHKGKDVWGGTATNPTAHNNYKDAATIGSGVTWTDPLRASFPGNVSTGYIRIPHDDAYSVKANPNDTMTIMIYLTVTNWNNSTNGDQYIHWMGKGTYGGTENTLEWGGRHYVNSSVGEAATRQGRVSCYYWAPNGGTGNGAYTEWGDPEPTTEHIFFVTMNATSTGAQSSTNYIRADVDTGTVTTNTQALNNGTNTSFVVGGPFTGEIYLGKRGSNASNSGALIGKLRRFAVWNRALTTAERNTLISNKGLPEGQLGVVTPPPDPGPGPGPVTPLPTGAVTITAGTPVASTGGSNIDTLSIAAPALSATQAHMICVTTNTSVPTCTVANYTKIGEQAHSSTGTTVSHWFSRRGSASAGTATVVAGSTGRLSAVPFLVEGADLAGTPFAAVAGSASLDAPSQTAAVNDVLLTMYGNRQSVAGGTFSFGVPAGMAEVGDISSNMSNSASNCGTMVATQKITTAGSTGPRSATVTDPGLVAAMSLLVKPAGATTANFNSVEAFELSDAALVTANNTAYDAFTYTGDAPRATVVHAVGGDTSLDKSAATGSFEFTTNTPSLTSFYRRFYIRPDSMSIGDVTITSAFGSGGALAWSLRLRAGTNLLQLTNGAGTQTGVSSFAVPQSEWSRIELSSINGTVTVRVYAGTVNYQSTSPTFSFSGTYTAAPILGVKLSVTPAVAWGVNLDEDVITTAGWVGPVQVAPSSNKAQLYYHNGTQWINVTDNIKYDTGTQWVTGTLSDIPTTGTPTDPSETKDSFGITKLRPDATNAMKWEANWATSRTFTGVDPQDPWFDADHGDGSYTAVGGELRIGGAVPRMYVHDPAEVKQWRDTEMTVYFKRVADTSPAYAGMTGIVRSNHGTTAPELSNLCDTRGVGARMRIDGYVDFEKETSHPNSVAVARKQQWAGGLPMNVWLGYKYLCYDLPNGNVKLELYLDTTDGANGGTWVKINEFEDDGANMGVGGTACAIGVSPSLRLTNATARNGSESGKPNVTCYFRSDNVGPNGLVYKKASVREISVVTAPPVEPPPPVTLTRISKTVSTRWATLANSTPPPTGDTSLRTVNVSTRAQLVTALADFRIGDKIVLASGSYAGTTDLVITQPSRGSYTPTFRPPFTGIVGPRSAVIEKTGTTSGYALQMDKCNFVTLEGFSVKGGQKALMADECNDNILRNLDVGTCGMELLHLRNFSNRNVVEDCDIHHSDIEGNDGGTGEGVYIGQSESNWNASFSRTGGAADTCNDNIIRRCTITATMSECVDVKEGTTGNLLEDLIMDGGRISGENSADSYMDIKGNNTIIRRCKGTNPSAMVNNGFETHILFAGYGNNNDFQDCDVVVNKTTAYGYFIQESGSRGTATGNKVRSDCTAVGAGAGLTNIATTAPATATTPVNTAIPTISGTLQVGQTLSSTNGTWTNSPTSYTRQWRANGVNISGAINPTYTLTATETSKTITVTVTAINSVGASVTPAISAASAAVAAAPTGGTQDLSLPSGYTSLYARDFTVANSADDANWEVYTGTQGNNAGNFRAANVIKSGPNGQELIAQKTSSTATMYSGAVKNYAVAVPQYFYIKTRFRLVNFSHGSWPSLWMRPMPGQGGTGTGAGEGEIDFIEAFGSHIDNASSAPASGYSRIWGSTIILTPYGSQTNLNNSPIGGLDAQVPKSEWGLWHTFEFIKSLNKMETKVDGVLACTVSRPASGTGATLWDQQCEDMTKRWYIRLDHQAGFSATNGQAGDPDSTAYPYEARQQMASLVVGAKT